ncbi:MAG: hypothetical protein QNJ51_21430 [Calothrix sp. MO_167.B12]|nr:hypothetical protein [Calothrix sp. MO_167.B12]
MLSQKNYFTATFTGICFSACTMLAWFAAYSPVHAVNTSYKDYRLCAFQLLKVGIGEENASKACANALRPEEVSACVIKIERQTKLAAQDILAICRQARRPRSLAKCVNGISNNLEQESAKTAALDYCGRSLLPVRFASCVVGLRAQIKFEPVKAMDTCIDASELISNTDPSFIPEGQESQKFTPTFETQPIPENMQPIPENTEPTPENIQPTPENTEPTPENTEK